MSQLEAQEPAGRPAGSLRFALVLIAGTVAVLAGAAAVGVGVLLAVLQFLAHHL